MKQLIERYDAGVRDRIYAVVKAVTSAQGGARPAYVHDLSSLKTLPAVMYPMTVLNAAVNYREHGEEMDRRDGQPRRPRRRQGPRFLIPRARQGSGNARPTTSGGILMLFLKSPSAIVGEERRDSHSQGPHSDRLGV